MRCCCWCCCRVAFARRCSGLHQAPPSSVCWELARQVQAHLISCHARLLIGSPAAHHHHTTCSLLQCLDETFLRRPPPRHDTTFLRRWCAPSIHHALLARPSLLFQDPQTASHVSPPCPPPRVCSSQGPQLLMLPTTLPAIRPTLLAPPCHHHHPPSAVRVLVPSLPIYTANLLPQAIP